LDGAKDDQHQHGGAAGDAVEADLFLGANRSEKEDIRLLHQEADGGEDGEPEASLYPDRVVFSCWCRLGPAEAQEGPDGKNRC